MRQLLLSDLVGNPENRFLMMRLIYLTEMLDFKRPLFERLFYKDEK